MRKTLIRATTTTAALAIASSAGLAQAQDQDFSDVEVPSTIRVIVAYSAGGSSDALARVTLPYVEQAIEDLSGQSTNAVVVNLPGAGGEIGWTSLANADADGSTIGIINLPAVPIIGTARDAVYAPWLETLEPIGVNVIDPNIVRLGQDTEYDSLSEAIQAAIDEPGSVTVGADGPLSDDHLAMYALEHVSGATFTFIPYPGGSPANQAFRSGEVEIVIGNVFDYLETEDSTADAAILWGSEYSMAEGVAPAGEHLGMDVGELGSTRGFAAPAGMPEDLMNLYRAAFEDAFNNEDYQSDARERNITMVEPRIGDAFGDVMENQENLVSDLLGYFEEGGYLGEE